MGFSIRAIALAFATASFSLPQATLAASPPPRGPMPFSAFDRDGNGEVNQQEFEATRAERQAARAAAGAPMGGMASAPTFADLDLNGDGKLLADELDQARQRMWGSGPGMGPGSGMGPGAGMGPGMGPGMGMGRNMPTFADFDLNGDGSLTEEEFYQARGKRIQERASQGYPMLGLAHAPNFADIDQDKDGKVTPDELAAAQARHRQQMMAPQQP